VHLVERIVGRIVRVVDIEGGNRARRIHYPDLLHLYNPDYTPYDPFDKVHNNLQWTDGNNFSWGAKDAIKMFDGKVQGRRRSALRLVQLPHRQRLTGVAGKTNVGHTWTYNYAPF